MKCMIVLFALVAGCAAQWHGGAPQDTPEVAAAKAAHFAAVQQAQQTPPAHNNWNAQPQQNWNAPPQQTWNAPPQQQSWSQPQQAPQPRWQGPVALPPGFDRNGAPLPVQDTPEVANLKAAQINTLASAGGNVPQGVPQAAPQWNAQPQAAAQWNAPQPQWNAPQSQWNAPQPQWNAQPQAAPQWNTAPHQAGLPADTPEVAAAKAAHLAAHNAIAAPAGHGRWRRSIIAPLLAAPAVLPLTSYPGSTAPLLHAAPVLAHAAPVLAHAAPVHLW